MTKKLSRRRFVEVGAAGLVSTALLGAKGALVAGESEPLRRPNIILIMADDLGYESVTANGGESYETSNVDALAKAGMRFEHCYSSPLCAPTRLKLLTGLYNSRNYEGFIEWPKGEHLTIGNVMQLNGYTTAINGKWHFAIRDRELFRKSGFDRYNVMRWPWYVGAPFETDGKLVEHTNEEYTPDILNAYACDFIAEASKSTKPFFLYYPMLLPHPPILPPSEHADFDPNLLARMKNGQDLKWMPDVIRAMDTRVGRVIARLDELGLRHDTLVVFTGDNGTYVKAHSMFKGERIQGGKGRTHSRGIHVPLIASWPAAMGAGGTVNDDLVDFTDFLPTFAELAGGKIPKGMHPDGRSFAPQLLGEPGDPREAIYCWYHPMTNRNDAKPERNRQFAQTKRYKLYGEGDLDGSFYDIVADPEEERPIPEAEMTPEQRDVRARLAAVIERYTRRPPT